MANNLRYLFDINDCKKVGLDESGVGTVYDIASKKIVAYREGATFSTSALARLDGGIKQYRIYYAIEGAAREGMATFFGIDFKTAVMATGLLSSWYERNWGDYSGLWDMLLSGDYTGYLISATPVDDEIQKLKLDCNLILKSSIQSEDMPVHICTFESLNENKKNKSKKLRSVRKPESGKPNRRPGGNSRTKRKR